MTNIPQDGEKSGSVWAAVRGLWTGLRMGPLALPMPLVWLYLVGGLGLAYLALRGCVTWASYTYLILSGEPMRVGALLARFGELGTLVPLAILARASIATWGRVNVLRYPDRMPRIALFCSLHALELPAWLVIGAIAFVLSAVAEYYRPGSDPTTDMGFASTMIQVRAIMFMFFSLLLVMANIPVELAKSFHEKSGEQVAE